MRQERNIGKQATEKLLFPLIDPAVEIIIPAKQVHSSRVINTAEVLNPEAQISRASLAPLEERALMQKHHQLEVRGHLRRPSKAPQRTKAEGENLGRRRIVKDGLEFTSKEEQLGAETPLSLVGSDYFVAAVDRDAVLDIFGGGTVDETPQGLASAGLRVVTIDQLQADDALIVKHELPHPVIGEGREEDFVLGLSWEEQMEEEKSPDSSDEFEAVFGTDYDDYTEESPA